VEFVDGSMLAQLSEPTMTIPIQYAITYPKRCQGTMQPFNFLKNGTLQFFAPDLLKFRCLQLAYDAIKIGGSMPCYMNAANEVIVNSFLEGRGTWEQIATRLEDLMQKHAVHPVNSLDDILAVDAMARQQARSCLSRL
jgi:1-deoxy-D-xylulose-5-phosphate reductoisomerase